MSQIFEIAVFTFPYLYKFPGQSSDEKILFVTRENRAMLVTRRLGVSAAAVVLALMGFLLGSVFAKFAGATAGNLVEVVGIALGVVFGLVGWWWVTTLWRKSIVLVTTQRLAKIIYTTPFNRHMLSLPLDMIVDTGSYTKGFIQALFKLGTFTARSSASSSGAATDDPDRVNKKYFYIENIATAEDLQHYINKLLYAFRYYRDQIATFRPFIPHLKGDARKEFLRDWPEYWS